VDAHELPFAGEYFDVIVSVDSHNYFGNNDEYFEKCIRHLLKKGVLLSLLSLE